MISKLKALWRRHKLAVQMADVLLKQSVKVEDSKKAVEKAQKSMENAYALAAEYDPEKEFRELDRTVLNPIFKTLSDVVDAKLYECKFDLKTGQPKLKEDGSRDYQITQYTGEKLQKRLQEVQTFLDIPRLKEDFVDTDFTNSSIRQVSGITEYIPQMMGPFFRQLYITDYLSMHAKAYEHWNHMPVAHRIVKLLIQYALGKRIRATSKDENKIKIWNRFWRENELDKYHKFWGYERIIYGELMIRKFVVGGRPIVRSIDPATIWEIVHDPEDVQNVYYYHQQYPTAYFQYYGQIDPTQPGLENVPEAAQLQTKYIIRQIPADKILHYKTNCVSVERRGRSELFPILGWLKRVKDFTNAYAVKAQLQAVFIWDDTVNGNAGDIAAHLARFTGVPPSGSVFAHNEQIKRQAMPAMTGYGNDGSQIYQDVISLIAACVGIPKEHLNITLKGSGSRATALVGSEPFTKVVEDLQIDIENMLLDLCDWVMKVEGVMDYQRGDVEFVFPSVTKDTVSERIKNLLIGYNTNAISFQDFSEMYASEMDITGYDFDETQELIQEELKKGLGPKSTQELPPAAPPQENPSEEPTIDPTMEQPPEGIQGAGAAAMKQNLGTL